MVVRVEKDGAVWTVIHSRPEARNAMDPDSAAALYDAFLAFDAEDSAHVAVFWGEGGAFCAGWDLKHASALSGAEALDPFDFPENGEPPMAAMGPSRLELSKPVIAAVAGPAVAGGMELAIWADVRVMEESAFMGVYCRRWGVPLLDGGTIRLSRLIGHSHALDLILTGRGVSSDEAKAMGLANRLVEPGLALEKAIEMAESLTVFPQLCMRADRTSSYEQWGMSLTDALKNEYHHGGEVFKSGETHEGATRFAEGKGRHGDFSDI